MRFKVRSRLSVRFIAQRSMRLTNRPPKCAAAYFSGDGKAKVRVAGTQILGVKEFEKSGKEALSGVIAGQRRKRRDDLARGAMNGRNEDQQQEPLPHRSEQRVAAASQKIEKDFIGRRVLLMVVVVPQFADEFEARRKRGQYWAGSSK